MQINLKGNIVILDEAHNIEDVCRDVASVNITNDNLANAITDCENVLGTLNKKLKQNAPYNEDYIAYMTIWEYLGDMAKLLKNFVVKENVSVVSHTRIDNVVLELFSALIYVSIF